MEERGKTKRRNGEVIRKCRERKIRIRGGGGGEEEYGGKRQNGKRKWKSEKIRKYEERKNQ